MLTNDITYKIMFRMDKKTENLVKEAVATKKVTYSKYSINDFLKEASERYHKEIMDSLPY